MDIAPFKILLGDAAAHSLLLADGPGGEILAEIPLPADLAPVEIVATQAGRAYIPCAARDGNGALLVLSLADLSLSRLPHLLSAPTQFVLPPEANLAFITDSRGLLYALNPSDPTPAIWGKPPEAEGCAGLTADRRGVYGAWSTPTGGIIAYFDHQGVLVASCPLDGNPTFVTLDPAGNLLVTFSATAAGGEGLFVAARHRDPFIIPLLCPRCAGAPLYPCHISLGPGGKSAYIACEDSAGVAVIDLAEAALSGYINLGRSVSRTYIIAGGKFALASSNAFADLCLIDLVNRKPLSFSATPRELLSPLALLG